MLDRKMIKLLTFDTDLISCFRHHDIRAKTRSRMTTATTFSRQNLKLSIIYRSKLKKELQEAKEASREYQRKLAHQSAVG